MEEYSRWAEIAESNGIARSTFWSRVRQLGYSYEKAATKPTRERRKHGNDDVAIYKGDQFIIWGSIEEVAEKLNKSIDDIRFICFPSHRKRVENNGERTYGIYIDEE